MFNVREAFGMREKIVMRYALNEFSNSRAFQELISKADFKAKARLEFQKKALKPKISSVLSSKVFAAKKKNSQNRNQILDQVNALSPEELH